MIDGAESEPRERAAPGAAGGAPPLIDFDLYCLTCGYNLRGLTGDPVCCPECAALNALGEAVIPATEIRKQLDILQHSLAGAVAAALIVGLYFLAGWILIVPSFPAGGVAVEQITIHGAAVLVAVAGWTRQMGRFRTSCRRARGWFALFMLYNVLGLGACACILAAIAGVAIARDWGLVKGIVRHSWAGGGVARVLLLAWAAFVFTAVLLLVKSALHYLGPRIDALQRETAVEIARDVSRRRVHDAKRAAR